MAPIHVAVQEDDLDEVQRLVQSGEAGVNDRDDEGFTALHRALLYDRLRIMKWLVEVLYPKQIMMSYLKTKDLN